VGNVDTVLARDLWQQRFILLLHDPGLLLPLQGTMTMRHLRCQRALFFSILRAGDERMRLSEAIKLGAMWSPQARGAFFQQRGEEVATCALGAAFLASGMEASAWVQHWPILHVIVRPAELPEELQHRPYPMRILEVIVALNDCAGWSRTRISDWVEAFENHHPESSGAGERCDPRAYAQFALTGEFDEDQDDLAAVPVG
jgi:hypothetical protein